MLFPTFGFLFFFLAVFIGFWYVFRRSAERRVFLVAASYLFYAFWDWRFCGLLLASTAANYGFALLIANTREHFWRKGFLVLSVVFNLLLLGFFKYYNFFSASANGMIALASGGASAFAFPALNVLLPVGISYFTFKAMSYVFDVYLCALPVVKPFLDVALYVSFFPQIASGPIVHAKDFIPQIGPACDAGADPDERTIDFDRASVLVMSGLVKKMVFANFLSTLFVNPVFADLAAANSLEVLLAALAYSVVIYCDFSGYSDMAIGVALLLGFSTPANFDRPYASNSVTDFWKRWHITFSSWLRDYLYFSLGGSRFGKVRTVFALFVTMMLGGLWHGASLTFVVWGAMQGLALAFERVTGFGAKKSDNLYVNALHVILTFAFTTLSWIVFRASSIDDVLRYFTSLGNVSAGITRLTPLVCVLLFAGLFMHAISPRVRADGMRLWRQCPLALKGALLAVFFAVLSVMSMSGVAPFIYFQF